MNERETGGTAFPAFEVRTHDTGDLVENASQGMTLRDYFAAKAMQGLATGCTSSDLTMCTGSFSEAAYKMADAMLRAREA